LGRLRGGRLMPKKPSLSRKSKQGSFVSVLLGTTWHIEQLARGKDTSLSSCYSSDSSSPASPPALHRPLSQDKIPVAKRDGIFDDGGTRFGKEPCLKAKGLVASVVIGCSAQSAKMSTIRGKRMGRIGNTIPTLPLIAVLRSRC
jgi:hypothetical protein